MELSLYGSGGGSKTSFISTNRSAMCALDFQRSARTKKLLDLQANSSILASMTTFEGAICLVLKTTTLTLVTALWERKRPLMLQRLTVLDQAAEAAAKGDLSSLCQQALNEAHKLAGSLGVFGFPRGTEIARELEQELERGTLEPEQILLLTKQLREALFPATSHA